MYEWINVQMRKCYPIIEDALEKNHIENVTNRVSVDLCNIKILQKSNDDFVS